MPLTWWASKNRLVLGLFNFHLCFLQAQGFFVPPLLRRGPISFSRFSVLLSDHLSLPDFVESFFPQVALPLPLTSPTSESSGLYMLHAGGFFIHLSFVF